MNNSNILEVLKAGLLSQITALKIKRTIAERDFNSEIKKEHRDFTENFSPSQMAHFMCDGAGINPSDSFIEIITEISNLEIKVLIIDTVLENINANQNG